MSRRTTPGSIGRKTLSHSERGTSSALAGRGERPTPSNGGRTMAAAVSAINCLRLILAALQGAKLRGGKLWGRRRRGVVVVGLIGVKMEFEKSVRDDAIVWCTTFLTRVCDLIPMGRERERQLPSRDVCLKIPTSSKYYEWS